MKSFAALNHISVSLTITKLGVDYVFWGEFREYGMIGPLSSNVPLRHRSHLKCWGRKTKAVKHNTVCYTLYLGRTIRTESFTGQNFREFRNKKLRIYNAYSVSDCQTITSSGVHK